MNKRSIVNFFSVASLLALLLAVALLSAILTMHFAIHGAEVQVPALKGMTVAEARSQAAGLGLNLDVDNRYYSGEVAAGHILTQTPAPGTVVRREWRVRVAESLGSQQVDVPDIVGKDDRVAELELRRAGLDTAQIVHLPFAKAREGVVLAQDPPAHSLDIAKPSVSLLLAAPDDETADGYVMPDLTGWPDTSAIAALAKLGIHAALPIAVDVPVAPVGSGDALPKLPIQPGAVLSQTPPAGSRVDQTAIVRLTVAK